MTAAEKIRKILEDAKKTGERASDERKAAARERMRAAQRMITADDLKN